MNPKEFWSNLEYRVCREIDGLRNRQFPGLWCDGFIPDPFDPATIPPALTGIAWMGNGSSHQDPWHFTLILPNNIAAESDLDWNALIPPDTATGWLSLNPSSRTLIINPNAAYADPA
ncbi:MAG TPA: hypothetical protein VFE58_15145 [Tepidisphaeraceae bacterium]|jgi:hypothetical protein|nr:hypothetical protein [Tepidisphaeraceae bacterium]